MTHRARPHLEIFRILVMLVQGLREDEEREARRLKELCASTVAPRLLLFSERRLDGREHAHEHEEAVHLPKDVLRARVLNHDTVYLDQYLRAYG